MTRDAHWKFTLINVSWILNRPKQDATFQTDLKKFQHAKVNSRGGPRNSSRGVLGRNSSRGGG